MKFLKYVLIFIMAAALIVPFTSCGSDDGDTSTVSDTEDTVKDLPLYEYEEADDGVVITLCRLLPVSLEVPRELDGRPVVGIADGVFKGIKEMESAVIPEGIKTLGASVFEDCENLEDITLPSSIVSVGERAFRGTPWLEAQNEEFVIIGDGVAIKYSGEGTEVTVPADVKFLADAFAHRDDVTSVTVSDGVSVIGPRAFSGMESLTSVTIPESVKSIGNSAFTFCTSLKEIEIPETVTELGEFAFSRCSALEKARILAKLTEMKLGTFANCTSLKEVVLPEGIETLENAVFENCPSLESVNFPSSLTSISRGVFDEGVNVTVKAEKGSYAEGFCAENSIKTVQ